MSEIPRIFISATTLDLGSYRRAVAEVLLKLGAHPVVQDHFPPDHRSVVEMLRARIKPCDAVICLVGRVYGQEPSKRQPGEPRRSYTQLEYEIAVELHKRVFVFIAADDCPFDHPSNEPEELCGLQTEHLRRIKASDRTRVEFRSGDHLTDQVRIMRFDSNQTVRRGAVVGAIGVIGLALAAVSWPGRDGGGAAAPPLADPKVTVNAEKPGREGRYAAAPAPLALSGELSVRVWGPGRGAKRALKVEEPGALPLRAGESRGSDPVNGLRSAREPLSSMHEQAVESRVSWRHLSCHVRGQCAPADLPRPCHVQGQCAPADLPRRECHQRLIDGLALTVSRFG